ncbi:hypothetical protein [Deinococcus multiflagellatus]|uniref:Transposase n=1 Tax=Deinococcus multiflagellatus TaxID=1656887 RepID=A0ABW1ZG54_9DEIO|nr:hypothetical protein [Deinococcus multiflagellatus]MBZ9712220.1 hypothetical protein [Deinococcus multiflagellatus]
MSELSPRQMTPGLHYAWVRDLRPLDNRQREAFLASLAMHYGQSAADKIRRDVNRGVAA